MMAPDRPLLYLIDGNSYIYRAFYAIPPLSSKAGFPTNAVYGFVTMLRALFKDKEPDYLAVIFDAKGPTHRSAAYAEYKANRPPMPEGLVPQIPLIHDLVRAYRIPLLMEEGYEADDLIGTCARLGDEAGFETMIISGDKDMLQLVSPHVFIYDPMKDKIIDEAGVSARFGVGPDRVIEIMGLMGDSSDNIPGVPGIGEKTAVKLIREYGTIDNIFLGLEAMKPSKLKENLRTHAELARLSRKLATIDRNVPVPIDIESYRVREPDIEKLREIFTRLEFFSLMGQLEPAREPEIADREAATSGELDRFLEKAAQSGEIILDAVVVRGTRPERRLAGLGIGLSESGEIGTLCLNESQVRSGPVRRVLEDPAVRKVGHDLKALIRILRPEGIRLRGTCFDTMIASYLIDPARHRHTLEEIVLAHLGQARIHPRETAGASASAAAAFERVDLIRKVRPMLDSLLKEGSLTDLFSRLEMPLVEVLAEMELTGVQLDIDLLRNLSGELEILLEQEVARIYSMAGGEFNINSPRQLSEILFERLKLKPGKKTKTGYSTDEGVLTQLAVRHELPAEILNYRQLTKLKSTYVDALPKLVNPSTGRLHTTFNQVVAATGRLSSSDPNLQNIPVRGEWGMRIRDAFIAPEGWKLVSADYNQIELRILAHLSQDRQLIQTFREGEDIHRKTAAQVFGVAPEGVTREMRRAAKSINFGILYGMGAFSLASDLGISLADAKGYIANYFALYEGVKRYIDQTVAEVKNKGYVTTLMNRRRWIPELKSSNPAVRSLGERLAVNTPVQGSAADLIKLAMVSIGGRLASLENKIKMVLQIHDELLFEVADPGLDEAVSMIRREMEGVMTLAVPLTVDLGIGKNWREAH